MMLDIMICKGVYEGVNHSFCAFLQFL